MSKERLKLRLIVGLGVVMAAAACGAANNHGRAAPEESQQLGTPSDPAERACSGRTPLDRREYSYGADVAPRRIQYVIPEYPKEAARLHVRGIVILQIVIDISGVVRQTRVIRSIPTLDDAARAAVCRWLFTPARIGGATIPVGVTVTVEFPPAAR